MNLGLLTSAFPNLGLSAIAQWAGANGFQSLEIACWPPATASRRYGGVCHINVQTLSQSDANQTVDALAKLNLKISALAYYPNLLSNDLAERQASKDHLLAVIKAASLLKVPIVGTFIGRDQWKTAEENMDLAVDIWPPIFQAAADLEIKIAIENCPMIFSNDEWPGGTNLFTSPARWDELWARIPAANFGLNLDPSHLILQMIDIERVVREYGPRIFHVHAKDLMIDAEGLYKFGAFNQGMGWGIPRLPGLGQVNWARFIAALYQVGYDSVISVEHEDRNFEGTEEKVKKGFLLAKQTLQPLII